MNCLNCAREVVQQAKFCNYCGQQVTVACPSCRILNPLDGQFCNGCGQSLSGRQAGLYLSPRVCARWTIGLLVATCIFYGLYMAATFNLLRLILDADLKTFALEYILPQELSDAMRLVDRVSDLSLMVFIPTVVLFLMWVHRVSRNLQTLGAHGQRFSPGWAVGWWFVPVMNFFRPYEVMEEIWQGSDGALSYGWRDRDVSQLLPWWWVLWIASWVAGLIAAYIDAVHSGLGTDAVPSAPTLLWDLLGSALSISAGVLAIMVVRLITKRQEEAHRRMP